MFWSFLLSFSFFEVVFLLVAVLVGVLLNTLFRFRPVTWRYYRRDYRAAIERRLPPQHRSDWRFDNVWR